MPSEGIARSRPKTTVKMSDREHRLDDRPGDAERGLACSSTFTSRMIEDVQQLAVAPHGAEVEVEQPALGRITVTRAVAADAAVDAHRRRLRPHAMATSQAPSAAPWRRRCSRRRRSSADTAAARCSGPARPRSAAARAKRRDPAYAGFAMAAHDAAPRGDAGVEHALHDRALVAARRQAHAEALPVAARPVRLRAAGSRPGMPASSAR